MSRVWEWVRQHAAVIVTLCVVVVLTAVALWPIDEPQPVNAEIQMSFGLDREPLTRTFQIDGCKPYRPEDPPDAACRLLRAPADGDQGTNSTSTVSAERPAIVATTLLGDLTPSQCESLDDPADAESVPNGDTAGGFQFPADQVTVASELRGSTAISVRVTADPWKPEQVPGGTYCHWVLVERESGHQYFVRLAVSLVDREDPVALYKAAYALVIGALIGVLVRLLNDPLGPMIRLRRRHRALTRASQQLSDPEVRQAAENLLREAGDAMVDLDVEDSRRILEEVEGLLRGGVSDTERQASLQRAQTRLAEAAASSGLLARERRLFRLLDRYWLIGIGLIVVLVVVTGLQSLYVNNQDFDGRSSASWLGLVAFGLAAQVTVGSLAEAAGKLSPSGNSGRSGT